MILGILLFTLGLLVAGLLALAALPAVWRRALRLSGERLARLVPLSPEEIAADRDQLRAAHAVELRRTEQRVARAEAERATLQVEAGRRESRVLHLEREGARAQVGIATLEAEAAAARRERDDMAAEAGAREIAMTGLAALAERRWLDLASVGAVRAAVEVERDAAAAESLRLGEIVDGLRAGMAGLQTRLLAEAGRADALERDRDQLRRDLSAESGRAAARTASAGPADPGNEPGGSPGLDTVLPRHGGATAPERAEPGAPDRDELRRLLDARDRQIEGLTAELAFMSEQAASAERRATAANRAHEALLAERAAEGAAREAGPVPSAAPGPPPGDEAARLRAAIASLADDILAAGRTG